MQLFVHLKIQSLSLCLYVCLYRVWSIDWLLKHTKIRQHRWVNVLKTTCITRSRYIVVLCLVAQSCLTLCSPVDCSPPGSSGHGDSPDKNTGVGCHALLQRIFPTQGLKPGLLHCRPILYHLSYQGSTRILEWAAYPSSKRSSQPRNQT